MRKHNKRHVPVPTLEQIEAERNRLRYNTVFFRTVKSTIAFLIVVSAIAVLIATIWIPVLRVYGNSMSPTINEGDVLFSVKGSSFRCGDMIGFYYGNKILVKRVIAGPGQWVDISADGDVTVDGDRIDEPYLTDKAYGDVSIDLPFQVPDGKYFVMGDHRSTSSDSRSTVIGCVAEEQVIGKIVLRVWPLSKFSWLS